MNPKVAILLAQTWDRTHAHKAQETTMSSAPNNLFRVHMCRDGETELCQHLCLEME